MGGPLSKGHQPYKATFDLLMGWRQGDVWFAGHHGAGEWAG